jgi:hypothetical protein
LDFKDFSMQVINSQHGILTRDGQKRQPRSAEITARCRVRYSENISSRVEAISITSASANSGCCTKAPATSSTRTSKA